MRLRDLIVLGVVIAAVLWFLAFWLPAALSAPPRVDDDVAVAPHAVGAIAAPPPALVPPTYLGHDARAWHDAYVAQRRRTRTLKRTLLHDSTVTEALNLACAVYGGCATLWRRARCESKLDPGAVHKGSRFLLRADHAAGLLQFLPSTWRTTPFAGFSIFSPYANALAAGWMNTHGRGGEWDCR